MEKRFNTRLAWAEARPRGPLDLREEPGDQEPMLVRIAWISPCPAGVALTVRYVAELEGLALLARVRRSSLLASIRRVGAVGPETREEFFASYEAASRRERELRTDVAQEIAP